MGDEVESESWGREDLHEDHHASKQAADTPSLDPSAAAAAQGFLPRPDVLICDPGRNGMPKPFRRFLSELRAPVVIFIGSSRPFLRDCVLLGRRGYELQVVAPFDSYPHTARFEMVAKFQWRGTLQRDQHS